MGHGPAWAAPRLFRRRRAQIFLQAQPALQHGPRRRLPHVAVMPRLIPHPGHRPLVRGIAQDEAVFHTVGHQPPLDRGVLLPLVQKLVGQVHDVHRQPGLVLAGSGAGHPPGGLFLRLLPYVAPGQPVLHLGGKQPLLGVPASPGGADHGLKPRRPAIVHHPLKGGIGAAVHGVAVFELGQLRHREALRQRVLPVHQQQRPVLPRRGGLVRRGRGRGRGRRLRRRGLGGNGLGRAQVSPGGGLDRGRSGPPRRQSRQKQQNGQKQQDRQRGRGMAADGGSHRKHLLCVGSAPSVPPSSVETPWFLHQNAVFSAVQGKTAVTPRQRTPERRSAGAGQAPPLFRHPAPWDLRQGRDLAIMGWTTPPNR